MKASIELFSELVFTNNEKALRPTDYLLKRAWVILCEKHTKPLSADAIRVLLAIDVDTEVLTTSSIANQLCDLFDAFTDERSLCVRGSSFHRFTLTFEGDVMKAKMLKEISKKYNQHLCNIGSPSRLELAVS